MRVVTSNISHACLSHSLSPNYDITFRLQYDESLKCFEVSASSTRCGERECKILMMEFFNSLMLVRSLYEVLSCSRYVDTPTGATVCFICRQATLIVGRALSTGPTWLSTCISWESGLVQTGSVLAYRQHLVSGQFSNWIQSSFLIQIQSGLFPYFHGLCGYIKRSITPIDCIL